MFANKLLRNAQFVTVAFAAGFQPLRSTTTIFAFHNATLTAVVKQYNDSRKRWWERREKREVVEKNNSRLECNISRSRSREQEAMTIGGNQAMACIFDYTRPLPLRNSNGYAISNHLPFLVRNCCGRCGYGGLSFFASLIAAVIQSGNNDDQKA